MEFASSSLSSSSSSSFLKSEPHFIHDVFINFGGEDIGRRFVSHLHSVLLQAQVKTFISQENLQEGMKLEDQMRAIGGTKITIIVFSKSYAESIWCLLELEKIIECHETFGQIVLPVFYEIDPSDVRHQKDDFGKALEESAHKSYSAELLKYALSKWSRTLTTAAGMTGWDVRNFRDYVTEILNGCGLQADIGITVLIERGLIKVERNNKLQMHPLLRDVGREIIHQECSKEPGKRSRLWFQEDVVYALKKNTGSEAIFSLKLDFRIRHWFAFEEMKRLRLLQLHRVKLSEDCGHIFKELRWICWRRFPYKCIPKNFNLENVIAIDFKHNRLHLVWEQRVVLERLKFLNLSHSKYLKETPDFSGLPSLEQLILKDCPSLLTVHPSIADLSNIRVINLKDCTSLTYLATKVYKLRSLKALILSGCSNLRPREKI